MRNFWILYGKEMKTFFISPVAYLVFFAYALLNGIVFRFWLGIMITNHTRDYTIYQALLGSPLFWFVLLTQAPVITMRTLSEEYKMGTIEMLLTAPVREWEIVLSKFFATLTFYALLWISIPVNLGFLQCFSLSHNLLTWGTSLLPMGMILLLGCLYVSIGLFTSAMTKNQILAAIFCFAIIFIHLCLNFVAYTSEGGDWRSGLQYISALEHMDTACHGILDTRPIVFYLSGTAFFLFLTQRVLEGRRLKA